MVALNQQVDNLEKSVEQIVNRLDDLGRGIDGDVHYGESGASASFYETVDSDSVNVADLVKTARVNRGNTLPRGYKKRFGSFSEFLAEGMRGSDKFKSNYAACGEDLIKADIGLNTMTGEEGGMLVLPEFAPRIIEENYYNDLWNRIQRYTVGGNGMTFLKTRYNDRSDGKRGGGVRSHWRGEADSYTSSKPNFDDLSLKLKKLTVMVYITEEMLSDSSYVLEQYVSRMVREEFNFKTGLSVTRGNGSHQPLGYLNAPGTVTVAKEADQENNTIVAENVLNMYSRRRSTSSQSNGSGLVWTYNQNIEPQLNQMVLGGDNRLVYTPPGGLSGKPYATLMGLPMLPTEFNSPLGSRGDLALCDFDRIIGIEKGGINESMSPHVEFERDILAFKFSLRLDSRPVDDQPLKPFMSNGADYQSAFVVLADRKGG